MTDFSRIEFFQISELKCRCGKCGTPEFHPTFVEGLDFLRKALHRPMQITSGARCAAYNKQVGGHPRSLHVWDEPQHEGQLGCMAVDVAFPANGYRGDLFALAWKLGFSIGWGRGFLHLDRRQLLGLATTTFDY